MCWVDRFIRVRDGSRLRPQVVTEYNRSDLVWTGDYFVNFIRYINVNIPSDSHLNIDVLCTVNTSCRLLFFISACRKCVKLVTILYYK